MKTNAVAVLGVLAFGLAACQTDHHAHRHAGDMEIAAELPTVTPHLMFTGDAEEAITLYTSLFEDGEILELQRYGQGEAGPEGTVFLARFRIAGQEVTATDSPPVHDFTFTPSFSMFVICATPEEVDRVAESIGEGGGVLMPVGDYGFSDRFAWVTDRFGVSWQVSTVVTPAD